MQKVLQSWETYKKINEIILKSQQRFKGETQNAFTGEISRFKFQWW